MTGQRGGRNDRPSGGVPRRGRGRTTPAAPGRGSRGGAGPTRSQRRPGGPASTSRSTQGADGRPDGAGRTGPAGSAGKSGQSADLAGAARSRRSGLTGRAAILALVLAALVISYASSLRAWSEQQSRLADLRAEASQRSARVAELEKELERWHDPAYVEAQARERFGWVMPGEVGYVVVGKDDPAPKTAGGAPSHPDRASDQPAWWNGLWGSVEKAGRPPAPTTRPARPAPAATIDPEEPTPQPDR